LKGLHGARLRAQAERSLEQVGLAAWARKRVEALSKGMSQKLQFVCAVLHEPELVILDEPFSGLDPLNVDMLETLIADLRQKGTTVIFSTHQMNQAERICDRIVLLNRARKVIEGTINEVRSQFATRVLIMDAEGDLDPVAQLPGIERARITLGHARLQLTDDADPNAILERALKHVRVLRFEIQRPDLQEIFVKLVGGQRPGAAATTAEVAHG
jgi:ABC-2 type transport system ATP-binding protein